MEHEEEDRKEKEVEEIPEKKEELPNKKGKLTEKMRENPWILSTLVLGIVTLILLIGNFSGGMTGKVVSSTEVGNNLIEHLNTVADSEVTLIDVEDDGDFYQVTIEFKGEEMPVYVTKDGAYYTSNLIPLISVEQGDGEEPDEPEGYSEEDLEKLSEFSSCLAQNGIMIYGANWCGWTEKLVIETLGGFDVAAPIYVECTDPENEEICSQMVDTGYPTIKLNGKPYTGARTLEDLGEATGCPVPEVSNVQSSTEEASCG